MKVVEYGTQNHEVIILLHGGGLSWWNYKSEAELLSDRYHVILPVLDGHAGSDADFISIENNAARIISFIDQTCDGSVLLIGGLSLGAQILTEILTQRKEICRYAVIESASVIPSYMTNSLISPSLAMSYGLIRRKWFAKMQFRYLRIRPDLFDFYCRDTAAITRANMTAFLKASTGYALKTEFYTGKAEIRIIAGSKEQRTVLQSAEILHQAADTSRIEIKENLYHGMYSINQPERYVNELLDMIR